MRKGKILARGTDCVPLGFHVPLRVHRTCTSPANAGGVAVEALETRRMFAAITPGNILAASDGNLIEYTTSGAVVQQIAVPLEGGGGVRDLMVDRYGNVQMYNGTFTPLLTQYDPRTNVFTHQPSAFSTVNNLTYGGLAAAGDYVFVTDMDTNGSPGRGLVRYHIGGGPTVAIEPRLQYIDVTLGFDGKIYALRGDSPNGGGGGVDVYDPDTAQSLGFVQLATEVRAIAVDDHGEFFAVGTSSPITHFGSDGHIIKTLADTIGGLGDVDLDASGRLVLASHSGGVAFTTTALDSVTGFNHRNRTDLNFVAWTDPGIAAPPQATVTGRHAFYNQSSYDGRDSGANAADDAAIATDKAALLPGQVPSFANVTTYDKGINGVMVDIANLPAGATLTSEDFEVGGAGLQPTSVTVRASAGVAGSARVTLTWPDYKPLSLPAFTAIGNGWLRVTLKANANTGLASPDVFYFGNLIGDIGDGPPNFRVNALDLGAVKRALNTRAPLDSTVDFNRDGRVNALDLGIAKRNLNHSLAPPSAPLAAEPRPVVFEPMPFHDGDASPTRRIADEVLP